MIVSAILVILLAVSCLGQPSAGTVGTASTAGTAGTVSSTVLGGVTGTYGNGTGEIFFCHDPAAGVYQYNYANGFGFGNISQAANGSWTGSGIWVECTFVGGETLTLDNNTLVSNWWYNVPGDAESFLGEESSETIFLSARRQTPIEKTKQSGQPFPTLEQCWWLNPNVNTKTTNLSGKFHTPNPTFDINICLGNKYGRLSFNGTLGGPSVGSSTGAIADWIAFTGIFEDYLATSCTSGCDMYKLGLDGNTAFHKFWCDANPATTTNITELDGVRVASHSDVLADGTPVCLVAPVAGFGFRVQPLVNATFT
jgi:hypothetical protein